MEPTSEKDYPPEWLGAIAVAAGLSVANSWRGALAGELHRAAGGRALAGTCGPGRLSEMALAQAPGPWWAPQGDLIRQLDPVLGTGPFVAAAVRIAVEEPPGGPAGPESLLATALWNAQAKPVGLLAVEPARSGTPVEEQLRCLAEVGRRASATLRHAMELAVACGLEATGGQPARAVPNVSEREKEIARLVAAGMSDLNIASTLGIAEDTVGSHLRRLYAKLGIHSRVELARVVISSPAFR